MHRKEKNVKSCAVVCLVVDNATVVFNSRLSLGYIFLSSVATFQDDAIAAKTHFFKAFKTKRIEDFTEEELASLPDGESFLIILYVITLAIVLELVVAAAHYASRRDADTIF